MKAVIMAGGEGSRLRPMTCACPKPMVSVADRPVMAYALNLLSRHGISEAAVTLMYLPDYISGFFGDGSEYGVKLRYFTESSPLGTAGSVALAREFLDETFVVLSGDGITNCDITRAVKFHLEKNADATMVLKKMPSPLEYGVVLTDQDDRVTRFVEKPGWGETCSDAVNTGIYILQPHILDKIPPDKPYDFGRDLFPALVAEGARVYGCLTDEYWCDVGDTAAYLKANFDVLDGKMEYSGVRAGCVNRMPGCIIDKSAILEAPCYIASGARIEAGSRIGAYSVIGSGSVIGRDSSVKRSVIWPGARVGEANSLRGCSVLSRAVTLAGVSAFEESVIGDGAVIGSGATIMSGVRVWPGKRVEDGERVDRNVVWGKGVERSVCDGTFLADSPSRAADDARALAGAMGLKRVVVARDASVASSALARAAVSGFMAQGVQVIDIQKGSLPLLRFALKWAMADGGAFVTRDGMTAVDESGRVLGRQSCRKVVSALARGDYAMPFSGITKEPAIMTGCDMGYVSGMLERLGDCDLTRARAAVFCRNDIVLSLAERVMRGAGISVRAEWEEEMMELGPNEIGVWLDETGQRADFADGGGVLTKAERALILCWAALESGDREIILPRGETRVAEELAANYRAELKWAPSDESGFQGALSEMGKTQFALNFDGIESALTVMARLSLADTTMREVLNSLSPKFRRSRCVPVELRDKGRIMRELSETVPGCDFSDGLTIEREGGWAFINPCGDRRECMITAEAASAEFAKELCDFCVSSVKKITGAK